MKKRRTVIFLLIVAGIIASNAIIYSGLQKGAGNILSFTDKINTAYISPKTYINLINGFTKKPLNRDLSTQQVEVVISKKSDEFIKAAFGSEVESLEKLLDENTKYIRSEDGSSFIRYAANGIHVEGYMATDKRLSAVKQRWHLIEDDNTVTCSMEVYIEDTRSPQQWYLHFRKVKDDWKIYMLENDV